MNQNPNRKLDRKPYNPTARYMVFIGIVLVMFGYLISGLVGLQLSSSEEYRRNAETRRTTKITLRGSRGMITDADAVILAKDEMIYNVTFYRDASQNSSSQYRELTQSIVETIEIIERNGNELDVDFVIERDPETNEWIFNFGSGVSDSVLQTRENQWRSNHYMTNLSQSGYPTPESCLNQLKKRYKIANTKEEADARRAASSDPTTYVEDMVLNEQPLRRTRTG